MRSRQGAPLGRAHQPKKTPVLDAVGVSLVVVALGLAAFRFLPVFRYTAALARTAFFSPYADHHPSIPDGRLRVLFIGNSYTFVNNLPWMLSELARAADDSPVIDTEMIVAGGATLRTHWEGGRALAAIRRGHWDYVVLQEQSTLIPPRFVEIPEVNDPRMFLDAARRFDRESRNRERKRCSC